jgi:hypothetical protein
MHGPPRKAQFRRRLAAAQGRGLGIRPIGPAIPRPDAIRRAVA